MHFLYLLFSLVFGLQAHASPLRTTYQAKIIKPDGYPLQAASVNFRFTILDPSASCVLYVEDFAAINMTDSAGLISFSLGSGIRSFPSSGTAATFANVFNNATTSYSCQTPGIYTPAANDNRKVVMQFQDNNGWQTLPAMIINAVPYAMYAWKADNATLLNGKADSAFVQYSTIPTCTASQALQYNGASFQCITAGGGGGASYTVTASDVTNALGYTPADSVSYTTVTSTVSSLNSSMTTINSQVNNLTTSMAAMTSSQWATSGTTINYMIGNVGIGTNAPTAALEVSGGVKLSGANAILDIPATTANAGYMTMAGELLLHANGDYNTYLGRSAGNLTGNGTQNTGIGHHALKDITNGYENVALGDFTMAKITTGGENTALGSEALSFSVSGSRNVAVGIQALMHNSSDENTVVGSYALNRTGNGSNNTGMGYAVMNMLTSGSNNVAAGWMALRNVTTGNSNIAIGYNAGSSITTGSGNIIIGGNTGATFATDSNNISINDGVGNERIRVLSSGNVGIGTTTAVTKLDVSGGVRISMEPASCAVGYAGTLRYNTGTVEFCNGTAWTALSAASSGALQMSAGTVSSPGLAVNGDSDTGIYSSGANSISLVASGSAGVTLSGDTVDLVGAVQVDPWTMYSQVPLQLNGSAQDPGYSFANGPSMYSPSVNVLSFATNGSERLRINTSGNVGIGTSAPTGRLNVVKASADTSQANAAVNIGSTANPTSLAMGMYDSNYAWLQTFATPLYINALGNNTIFNRDGGNVGVGIEAPVAKLQVSGEFAAGSTQTLQGNVSNRRFLIGDNNSYLNSGGGSNRAYIFGHGNTIDTGGSGSNNIFVVGQGLSVTSSRIAMGTGSEQFTILPSGNIGVGTSSPARRLAVANSNSTAYSSTGTAPSGAVGLLVENPSTTNSSTFFDMSVNGGNGVGHAYIGSVYSGWAVANPPPNIVFGTTKNTYTEQMALAGMFGTLAIGYPASTLGGSTPNNALLVSGSVGIGTMLPSSKLTVAGTIESSTGGFKFPDGTTQTAAAAVSGSVTGAIQYKSGSAFGAASDFVWDGTNKKLQLGGNVLYGAMWNFMINGGQSAGITGSYNYGIGNYSLQNLTSGSYNVAMGGNALSTLVSGGNNTALGHGALSQATGSSNIAIGSGAGNAITTGTGNVILGSNNGLSVSATSNNIIISDGSGNNRIHVDSTGEVGIGGTATPGSSLEIKARAATGGVNMVMVTDPVLTLNKVSAGDSSAIRFSNNGTIVWALGDLYGSSFNLWNAAASTYNFTVTASGNVGISNSAPAYKLDVSGDLRITGTPYRNGGDSAWIVPSDERLKDVSGKFNRGLREIANIETIYFNYKKDNPKQIDSSVTYTGVLAQEVQKQIPEAVKEDKEGFLSLNTTPIFWTMVNAIKELYVMVTGQDRELASVKEEVVELRKENAALKTYLCEKDPSAPICK